MYYLFLWSKGDIAVEPKPGLITPGGNYDFRRFLLAVLLLIGQGLRVFLFMAVLLAWLQGTSWSGGGSFRECRCNAGTLTRPDKAVKDFLLFYIQIFCFKGSVSRKLRPMLLYIIQKLFIKPFHKVLLKGYAAIYV